MPAGQCACTAYVQMEIHGRLLVCGWCIRRHNPAGLRTGPFWIYVLVRRRALVSCNVLVLLLPQYYKSNAEGTADC